MAVALLEKIKSIVGIYDEEQPYESRENAYGSTYNTAYNNSYNNDRQYANERQYGQDEGYYEEGGYADEDDRDAGTLNEQFRNQGDRRANTGFTGGKRAGFRHNTGSFGGNSNNNSGNDSNSNNGGSNSSNSSSGGNTNSNIVNLHKPQNYVLVSAKPDRLEDATLVCDHLKERHVIIVNVEGLEGREAQRIVDFIGGAVYALDGEIFDITNRIFAVAPNYVDLVSIQRDTKSKGFLSFSNQR